MMTPMPTQLEDAQFLAARRRAFCFSAPRTGKTGTAIMAADLIGARKILVVTTASGRGVWRKAFADWSVIDRQVRVLDSDPKGTTDVGIVSWGSIAKIPFAIGDQRPDVIILDEDHKAVNPEAARTQYAYGIADGARLLTGRSMVKPEDRVWHLSGTPAPHDVGNMWCRLRASFPERLLAGPGRPDVTSYEDFRARYCRIGYKKLSEWNSIPVVLGGQNEAELRSRLEWPERIYVRRTQLEVGIKPASYELMPLIDKHHRFEGDITPLHRDRILAAAAAGDTDALEAEIGPKLRRLTGLVKANAAANAAKEALTDGVDKLVLAYWHRDVGDALAEQLASYNPLRLDGATTPGERETLAHRFARPEHRIFLAQVKAAGEAIDLSAANELWMVESSSTPADVEQICDRIKNVAKPRPCFVRVCCIEGSIDEKIQASLLRLWTSIREVIQ